MRAARATSSIDVLRYPNRANVVSAELNTAPRRSGPTAAVGPDRRGAVLSSALTTFARFGYRKTSMDEVARAARISRPGLYFLFESKEDLFRSAVARSLDEDLIEVERI